MDKSTIVAPATPQGESAISIMRVSGPLSNEIAKATFNIKSVIKPRYANFGRYISKNGDIIDECLYVYFNNKSSYTGEDLLEIYSHGNPFIQFKIIQDLVSRGCIFAEPGEFTKRAFLNGKMDLSQAEAVEEIIKARSDRSLLAAQKLLSGELGKRISSWNDKILNLLSEIESQIDFSDEDVPVFHVEHFKEQIKLLEISLKNTENTAKYSSTIHDGINIVIFGAPNVGKSSLLNILVGDDRALVSDEAGTTRDFISENITIGKHRVRIVDTAGLRDDADCKIEKSGIQRTIDCIKKADFYLFVVDVSQQPPALFDGYEEYVVPEKTLIVFNKDDLSPAFEQKAFLPEFERVTVSLFDPSAGEFIKNKIKLFIEDKNIVPETEMLVVSERHASLIKLARKELEAAYESVGSVSLEFLASRLRGAISELAEVLGRFDNDKVLDKVFSNFCIGK